VKRLRDMADRIGIPEMTSFVAAIIKSEQLGVSMAKVYASRRRPDAHPMRRPACLRRPRIRPDQMAHPHGLTHFSINLYRADDACVFDYDALDPGRTPVSRGQ